ncbi:hypothetical protein [Paenibacillus sp. JNUCC31]|uniref:hypothetical protein n=1 Tax=Paenibacillus sp. JNUCC-31 TaxID=2777983 RepID=UPI001E4562EA|nr:hypothetical protein [Paenibacillus sp. JNUCC-31]
MVFGQILDPSIKRITIEIKENGKPIVSEAKLVEVGSEQRIWFVFLPLSAKIPYVIKGFNDKGEFITHKQIADPNDSGSMILGES